MLSTIESSKDKIHFHDVVLNNDSLITITAIAKDYGMSGVSHSRLSSCKSKNTGAIFAP
ncbi:MAG: phage antirepressor KilAC domain-containing protein, partial [Clostridium sp.]